MGKAIGTIARAPTIAIFMSCSDAMLRRDQTGAAWMSAEAVLHSDHAGHHSQQHRPLPLRARRRRNHCRRLLSACRRRDDAQSHGGATGGARPRHCFTAGARRSRGGAPAEIQNRAALSVCRTIHRTASRIFGFDLVAPGDDRSAHAGAAAALTLHHSVTLLQGALAFAILALLLLLDVGPFFVGH